jgi:hypothetical protein
MSSCKSIIINQEASYVIPKGALAIAEEFKLNSFLDRNIGKQGALAIAEALKINSSLTALHLYEVIYTRKEPLQ